MLAQLAMLALSILAIAATLLAIRSDKSEQLGGVDEEPATGTERRWTRVPAKRRRRGRGRRSDEN